MCALGFVVRSISRFFRCTADASAWMAVSRRPIRLGTDLARTSPTFAKVVECQRVATASAASGTVIWARRCGPQQEPEVTRGDPECSAGHGDPSREGSVCARRHRCHRTRSVGGVFEASACPSNESPSCRPCQGVPRVLGTGTEEMRSGGNRSPAIDKRDELKSELEAGQRRLVQLQAEMANPPPPPPQRSELEAEVQRLREELSKFTNEIHTDERPRVRQKVGSGYIPPMPGLVPGELYVWMEERQGELQEALGLGEAERVELSSKLSEGAVVPPSTDCGV